MASAPGDQVAVVVDATWVIAERFRVIIKVGECVDDRRDGCRRAWVTTEYRRDGRPGAGDRRLATERHMEFVWVVEGCM